MISSGSSDVEFDIEDVDIGEALEEHRLPLHHRLTGQGADVAQAEHGCAIADYSHQVALGGVFVSECGVALDLQAGDRHARSVRQAEIALRAAGLGGDDRHLPCRRCRMVFESIFGADLHGFTFRDNYNCRFYNCRFLGALNPLALPWNQGDWMQLGMIGLGRMGANMVRRLTRGGHQCVVFDQNYANVTQMASEGAEGAASLKDFVQKLKAPRAVWLMVPAGVVDSALHDLVGLLQPGDMVIDGGNSYYIDDIRRAQELQKSGLHYLDVGVSGGVWGLERGYCLMIGGEGEQVAHLDSIFKTLAPGTRRSRKDSRPREGFRHRRRGLPALRRLGRRPFRQDGAQRH